jgi:hypothetical protein
MATKNNSKADASSAGRFAKSTESHSSVTDKPAALSSTKIGKISAKFATKAFAEKDSAADQFRSDKKIQNSSSDIPNDDHCTLCNIKIV